MTCRDKRYCRKFSCSHSLWYCLVYYYVLESHILCQVLKYVSQNAPYLLWRNRVTVNLGFTSPCIIIHSNKSNQPDASISQVYCSSFNTLNAKLNLIYRLLVLLGSHPILHISGVRVKYSSTCFGHPLAHHQERINCSSRLQFTFGTWW
jgi:hypothetical protein